MIKSIIKSMITLLVLTSISGCGMVGGGGDRWTAVSAIRQAEEETKQELLRTKQAEFAADKEQGKQTISLTTIDSSGKPVTVSMDLAPVIKAAVGYGNNDTYGVDITTTALPEGVMAESILAVGGAAKDILNTPTATAFTVGAVIGGALSETGGGGTHINGETVTTTDSFNREEIHATGDGNTAYTTGRDESSNTDLVSE